MLGHLEIVTWTRERESGRVSLMPVELVEMQER
jgi:hypothetical protein